MKKKILLVSTLVIVAISAMFIACSNKNEPSNNSNSSGCTCNLDGEKIYASAHEMQEMGMNSCAEFAAALRANGGSASCY